MRRPGRGWLFVPAAALGVWAGVAVARDAVGPLVLQNVTASLPLGLYARVVGPTRKGGVVALRPPAAAHTYLSRLGYPDDALLLKRVVAGGGERVCREGEALVAGYRRVIVRAHDRLGSPLPSWSGCRLLRQDELFLLGDADGSFDSRYFGPVLTSEVIGVYRRLPL